MRSLSIAPQISVYLSFFIYALALGGIYPRLGDLQIQMGVGETVLGGALLGAALGAQISLMFAGPLVEKLGHRLVIIACIPLIGMAEYAASLAFSPILFFFCLIIAGLALGALEIVVNLDADRTELMIGRGIMNRSHGFWSFGFFGAGLIGAGASELQISPSQQLLAQTLIISIAAFLIFREYSPPPSRLIHESPNPRFVRPTLGILMLVLFTLSAMLLESAGIDWSVIFMRDTFDESPFVNGIAFASGALPQGFARFFADGFVDRFGRVKVAKGSLLVLGSGAVFVTFAVHPAMALIGFGLMGVGTGCIFPLAMSAAAQRTDRTAASNVASLAQFSFMVFLVAPPILGFIAEHFGIRWSFGIGIPLVVLSWLTTSQLTSMEKRSA
ncbi:MAG: MFS transporter [SAR324 cluster bacterium]|nr:MFS transporter [SAR324 cluster bacterium]